MKTAPTIILIAFALKVSSPSFHEAYHMSHGYEEPLYQMKNNVKTDYVTTGDTHYNTVTFTDKTQIK